MVGEMDVAEAQRQHLGGTGSLERSEKTKKVNAMEAEFRLMSRARV